MITSAGDNHCFFRQPGRRCYIVCSGAQREVSKLALFDW